MDITDFEIPLFSPNITEINFGIFDLWLKGYNEKEVLQLLQNTFYSHLIKETNEENNNNGELFNKIKNEAKNNEKDRLYIEKAKDNVFLVKSRIVNFFNTENKGNDYSTNNIFFQYFLCLYIKQQFYIFNILSYHLMNLDLRFSHFYIPISKNKILKLIKRYYNIDINLEKEIIKYKNINNITKYINDLVKLTNLHKISVKRQIENIKNMWRYILNIYERRDINISKLQKKRKISIKRVLKYIKTNFRLYKYFIKRENVLETNDNNQNKSFLFKNKKKRKGKKKGKKSKSKNDFYQYNIIKILESLVGISLAKRYFRLYWILAYQIEIPKKINISYIYFNNIILLILEKLQINDLILSKEYINISKNIYSTYKSNKNMDILKSKLFSMIEINNSLKNKCFIRLKCIINLLCCFRNSFEITKFFLIFIELQKNESFTNEQAFVKQNIGNNIFVNRIMSFIKEAENYSKTKKIEDDNKKENEKTKNF
ncbi:conserved Plasmodium protein, unknown function [Plasmodium gallinaceum]|uniref:Uncharacterized protein n=1 Tax=Plasmodium gallinaceum TaxID=5849 RepID=A0A1J1GQP3_PLAGA|nr:conserved Plasmodium protein, unknown function [Plasmodium gallinaceum]CRG94610.1 conserved Plasmodium protein, unknown function [Plasmodium gallinaceum]